MNGCYPRPTDSSRGIWAGGRPWDGAVPLLMIQISIIVVLSHVLRFLLGPLRQPAVVSQILAGIIVGPTGLGKVAFFREKIFSPNRLQNLQLVGLMGLTFYQFTIGVRTDIIRIAKARKKFVVIGLSSIIGPAAAIYAMYAAIGKHLSQDFDKLYMVNYNVVIWVPSSTIVTYSLLSELNLLNSKIGRLAIGCSLIHTIVEAINRTVYNMSFNVRNVDSTASAWGSILSFFVTIAIIVFGLRPAGIWIVRRTPKGKPLSDLNFLLVLVFALAASVTCAVIGHSPAVGAFYTGLAMPAGPPLGSTFIERLEGLTNTLFFPVFVATIGLHVDMSHIIQSISRWSVMMGVVWLLLALKAAVIVAVAPFCGMTHLETLTLAAVLNAKGIAELAKLYAWMDEQITNEDCWVTVLFNILVVAAVTGAVVAFLYKPSNRYRVHRRRTIQNSKGNVELRVLTCVYNVESVPTSINLLEAMCTSTSFLGTYVLHLMQLVGRVDTVLVQYRKGKTDSHATADTERIVNAFHTFEHKHANSATVHPYVAISPYNSMYEDVCSMALDTKASMIILPFHITEVHGTVESDNQALRNVNLDVLTYAPCSAAILIDHGQIKDSDAALTEVIHNVVAYFFGGPDDREALALAMRLASNGRTRATLVHFVPGAGNEGIGDPGEKAHDNEILREFAKESELHMGSLLYREEVVQDGEEMVNVILSTTSAFDLLIVGRKAGASSSLTEALSTWSEYPELGTIGDMLASSDSAKKVLTLVVQQQPSVKERDDTGH